MPGKSGGEDLAGTLCPSFRAKAHGTGQAGEAPDGRDYHGRSLEGREERLKVKVRDKDEFTLGRETVDLRYVEQLVDREQTESLAQMLKYAREHVIDGRKNVSQVAEQVWKKLETDGFSSICGGSYLPGGLAVPRRQEWYACLNRFRG